jgi:hypothetical protein
VQPVELRFHRGSHLGDRESAETRRLSLEFRLVGPSEIERALRSCFPILNADGLQLAACVLPRDLFERVARRAWIE